MFCFNLHGKQIGYAQGILHQAQSGWWYFKRSCFCLFAGSWKHYTSKSIVTPLISKTYFWDSSFYLSIWYYNVNRFSTIPSSKRGKRRLGNGKFLYPKQEQLFLHQYVYFAPPQILFLVVLWVRECMHWQVYIWVGELGWLCCDIPSLGFCITCNQTSFMTGIYFSSSGEACG